MINSESVSILVVEDDDVDVMAIERSFKKLKIGNPLYFAKDGIDAFDLLNGTNGKKPIGKPYIILLDLNMPRMDGFEFLKKIRAEVQFKSSIVFVLTTSKLDEDCVKAYNYNVAGYIVKSEAGQGFVDAVLMLEHYWRIVELPG
ncbi:MAG: response regulator receiver protein [uncultured bacterium]|nr:MAG: response regulator receiver protein [uncultured bacterium]